MSIYKTGLRKHNHRCLVCNKILQANKSVIWVNLPKGKKVLHAECGEALHHDKTTYAQWAKDFQR